MFMKRNKTERWSEKEVTPWACEGRRVKEFEWAHLLPDEHAGDDEAIHTQEDVQDVTQPWVIRHHGLWEEGSEVTVFAGQQVWGHFIHFNTNTNHSTKKKHLKGRKTPWNPFKPKKMIRSHQLGLLINYGRADIDPSDACLICSVLGMTSSGPQAMWCSTVVSSFTGVCVWFLNVCEGARERVWAWVRSCLCVCVWMLQLENSWCEIREDLSWALDSCSEINLPAFRQQKGTHTKIFKAKYNIYSFFLQQKKEYWKTNHSVIVVLNKLSSICRATFSIGLYIHLLAPLFHGC